jgi:N-acetyl-anhydromuramyl-L-alanine amidase AmpD
MTFPLLVVIHETLISAEDSIILHGDPQYYGSYHALIHRSGKITYLTSADCKAYAASNSAYYNKEGNLEQVENSVDDFAYHIALETPFDAIGQNNILYHTGYTKEQYLSSAWLCRAVGVQLSRIVNHSDISLNKNQRKEPRCFNDSYFVSQYNNLTNQKSIDLGILDLTI